MRMNPKITGSNYLIKNIDAGEYFPLIMSSIEQQILQRINPNERPKYLQSAKALVGTYINRQKAVLQNSAMQPT
jgi:hypothetical protein